MDLEVRSKWRQILFVLLDHKTGESIHKLLLDWNRKTGITLVVVTHNRELARSMDRIVTLVDGQIVEEERNGE